MNPNESSDIARRRYGSFDTVQRGRAFFDRFFTRRGGTYEELIPLPDQTGNSGRYLTTNGTDASWGTVASSTPGGSDTQVQFNDGGSFGGDAGLTYNKTTDTLSVKNVNNITSNSIAISTTNANSATNITVTAGSAVSGSSSGGAVSLTSGNGFGGGSGANIDISCGNGGSTGSGGDSLITAGNGGSSSGNGGLILLSSGSAVGSGRGGDITIFTGDGVGSSNDGGDAIIQLGDASNTNAKAGRLVIRSTHDSSSVEPFQIVNGYIVTSNATPTSSDTQVSPALTVDNNAILVEARIVAVRTGGTAGTAGDSAAYVRRALFKRTSGTVSLVGSVQDSFTSEDQAAWDATLVASGDNIRVQVTGALDNNIDWQFTLMFQDAT